MTDRPQFTVFDNELNQIVAEYEEYMAALVFCYFNEPVHSVPGHWRYTIDPVRPHVAGGGDNE